MYVYQWKNIRLVSVWISGLVHSEYYLLLALRFFSSFKPFQFSTETLFKVQSFDMSISLSVSFIGIRSLFPGGVCISHRTALIGLRKSYPMIVKLF